MLSNRDQGHGVRDMYLVLRKPRASRRHEGGLSLVELLVGVAVGLVVLAGAITVLAKISFSGLENTRSMKLSQQVRENLDFIRRDLQRAGYVAAWQPGMDWTNSAAKTAMAAEIAAFGTITLAGTCTDTDGDGANECTCVAYSYDDNEDGDQDAPDELFGFQLNGTALQSGTGVDCAGAGTWSDISEGSVTITQLTFEIAPEDSTNYEIEEGGVSEAGCGAGDICYARRKIAVVMEAQLTADSTVTVSMRDEIKVKNDRYYSE